MKERRLFVRFPMSGQVVLQPEQKDFKTLDCELRDVCFEGVGLYAPEKVAPLSLVKFIIVNRQTNVNISGVGRIVYCNPARYNDRDCFRIGVEFIDVDSRQVRAALMNLVESPQK